MMLDLKVMAYFKISLSTRNWDRAKQKGERLSWGLEASESDQKVRVIIERE